MIKVEMKITYTCDNCGYEFVQMAMDDPCPSNHKYLDIIARQECKMFRATHDSKNKAWCYTCFKMLV